MLRLKSLRLIILFCLLLPLGCTVAPKFAENLSGQNDDWKIDISYIQQNFSYQEGNLVYTPPQGMTFVRVYFKVQNEEPTTQSIDLHAFHLLANGKWYPPHQISMPLSYLLKPRLKPGKSMSASILFRVPEHAKLQKLEAASIVVPIQQQVPNI